MKKILLASFLISLCCYGLAQQTNNSGAPSNTTTQSTNPQIIPNSSRTSTPVQPAGQQMPQANQSIDHGAVEHNDPTKLEDQKELPATIVNVTNVPTTPVTVAEGVSAADTAAVKNGVMQNGQSNVSNPIRR